MFSMCSELTPRAHVPDNRIPQLMQPCSLQRKTNLWKWEIFSKLCYRIDFTLTLRQKLRSRQIKGACGQKTGRAILFPQRRERRTRQESEHDQLHFFLIVIFVSIFHSFLLLYTVFFFIYFFFRLSTL